MRFGGRVGVRRAIIGGSISWKVEELFDSAVTQARSESGPHRHSRGSLPITRSNFAERAISLPSAKTQRPAPWP
jgi:hypothetical protein